LATAVEMESPDAVRTRPVLEIAFWLALEMASADRTWGGRSAGAVDKRRHSVGQAAMVAAILVHSRLKIAFPCIHARK
jgi:hypothetical protein